MRPFLRDLLGYTTAAVAMVALCSIPQRPHADSFQQYTYPQQVNFNQGFVAVAPNQTSNMLQAANNNPLLYIYNTGGTAGQRKFALLGFGSNLYFQTYNDSDAFQNNLFFLDASTNLVGFGTYTATTCTNSGYVQIKDVNGTVRKVMICP